MAITAKRNAVSRLKTQCRCIGGVLDMVCLTVFQRAAALAFTVAPNDG